MPEEGSVLIDATVSRIKGPLRILVIDDMEDVREAIRAILERLGAQVTAVDSPISAQPLFSTVQPHLVVSDVYMPEKDGIELIRDLKEAGHFPDLLFVTGAEPFYARSACAIAKGNGFRVRGFVLKPFRMTQFQEFMRLYELE